MKVLVAGAGPAGLYVSYLLKRPDPGCEVRVVEQNPPDATFGFGVVFSDRALEFLQADDPATYDLITPELKAWVDLHVVHRGERVVIDGIGFAAIGRLHFLGLMQRQAASVGVHPEFRTPVGRHFRLRPRDRGRWRQFDRAPQARFRNPRHALHQQVLLVRDAEALRKADPDLPRERARHV
jgi:2-polyprenyl-6-methoxyphenol hydroxylase-like FAD-dependent oxidoreductase